VEWNQRGTSFDMTKLLDSFLALRYCHHLRDCANLSAAALIL
jgi:hypothetical protein